MKCMTIAGTRPEFIQTAQVTKAIRKRHSEIFVNTGQHYDDNMSMVFFSDLEIPQPDINLGIGTEGSSHAQQTGQMMIKLEEIMLREKPDWVLVYGDTNTTIAGAITAAKIHIPIAHIESGLRSFDRKMPEEINRILTDHISDLLFAPTQFALDNLQNEGITKGVFNVGDVRVDVLANYTEKARANRAKLLAETGLKEGEPFALATIHRASNTDDKTRLSDIVSVFNSIDIPVVLPRHPRLKKMLGEFGLTFGGNVRTVEPLGFLDVVAMMDACTIIVTDSGGLQKEAYMLNRPCVTVRDTTEWIETVNVGWNRLCEPEPAAFKAAVAEALQPPPAAHPDLYGAVGVCERIVDEMEAAYAKKQSAG